MNFNHKKMRTRNFLGAFVPFLLLATISVSPALVQDGPAKSVTLPSIFADHMVLQQGRPIKVWGQAQPASKVSVTFKGLSATTTAADDDGWEVVLPPFAADKAPADLRIAADTTVVLKDVLVGEVWLCSGQSNMAFPLKSERSFSGEKARADDPSIRFYDMEPVVVTEDRPFSLEEIAKITPTTYYRCRWKECTSAEAPNVSAIAYYFAREMSARLDVPIGIISNAVDGSPIEAWIDRLGFQGSADLHSFSDFAGPYGWIEIPGLHPFISGRARKNLQAALSDSRRAAGAHHPYEPSFLFEAGIRPLLPFAFRGVLWYQGESNSTNPALYEKLFPALVESWRRAFGDINLPFLYVQLSSISTERGYLSQLWPEFRDLQRRMLAIPGTGMAVSSDIGDMYNLHPTDKKDVALRLSKWALARVYGKPVEHSGPLYRSFEIDGNSIVLVFDFVYGGLSPKPGEPKLKGFEIAGQDGVFVAADAAIAGPKVRVSSGKIDKPLRVRYAWKPYTDANLVNSAGLPASTFTTETINLARGKSGSRMSR